MPKEGMPRRSLVREMQYVEQRLRQECQMKQREKELLEQEREREEEEREEGRGHSVRRVSSLPNNGIPHLEGRVIVVSNSAHCRRGSELLSDDEYMDAMTCDHHVTRRL